MEGVAAPIKSRSGVGASGLWIVLALVLLIRVPFLNQAVQGDDHQYITEATHALVDPLHPKNTKYVFLGDEVDQRGQPHPPLDAWTLAGLIALFGQVREVPFHAAYIGWSLLAAAAMWSLARRFSPQPLWATLLFVAVPVFVVNGNSFESDLPFLALWMAAIAAFCAGRLFWAAVATAFASMAAYQAVFLTPILGVFVWLFRRRDPAAWLVLLVPPVVLGAWQVFERVTTGAMPAAVLNGYFHSYGLQSGAAKVRNAIALFGHSWFLVFPALLPGAIALAWRKRREPETQFLVAWIAIFFAAALTIFFAGSARYLLPMAAPVALLASRQRARWLAAGFGLQLALGLGLAAINYAHWDGYRQFAREMRAPTENHRVWVDGLWGIRYYFERQGALPLRKGQPVRAGEFLVSSELGRAVDVNAPVAVVRSMEIRPAIPLRIIGLETASGFSSVGRGLWPFGISGGVVDRVRAVRFVERHPTLEYLPMAAREAPEQIVSGIFSLEGAYRWMSQSAVVVLKAPPGPRPLRVVFTIHPKSTARRVVLLLDSREIAAQTYDRPGAYTLTTAPVQAAGPVAVVSVHVDRTFTALPDTRELGIVLSGIGFAE
jgi:Dolichyl-phosphate-mannose-protein mannosyltransferase